MSIEQTRLFAMPRERHHWLEVLRGRLPAMAPPPRPDWVCSLRPLIVAAVARGLLVGIATGAICAALVVIRGPAFLVLAVPIGATVGLVVAVVPTLVFTAAIAAVAGPAHTPLRDPRRLHRDVWRVLLAGVSLLDLAVFLRLVGTSNQHLAVLLAVPTAIVLLLLRRAARHIVVAHAEACGWLLLGDVQLPFR
jgi:hypothetical protein